MTMTGYGTTRTGQDFRDPVAIGSKADLGPGGHGLQSHDQTTRYTSTWSSKSSCAAVHAAPRSNTSATTLANLGRLRKPRAGALAMTHEDAQVGTIAARSAWPR